MPAAILPTALTRAAQVEARTATGSLSFKPIAGSRADEIRVPENHTSQVVIRWGDALLPGARPVDTSGLVGGTLFVPGSAAAQEQQFGYNCDAIAFYPLESRRPERDSLRQQRVHQRRAHVPGPDRTWQGRCRPPRRLEPQES